MNMSNTTVTICGTTASQPPYTMGMVVQQLEKIASQPLLSSKWGATLVSLLEKTSRTLLIPPRSDALATLPVGCEDVEWWGLVAALVHLHYRVGDGVARHDLLVLHRGALEGFPHVDVLQ